MRHRRPARSRYGDAADGPVVPVVLRSAREREQRGALDRRSCRRSTRARCRRRRSSSSSTFPGVRRDAGPGQVEALLRIDGRVEPIIAQLTQQYTQNYQKSTNVESRLWHSVFDLVKAFIAAYTLALKAGYPRADNKRWRAILPWVIVRLAHYRGLDGKFRLFRYSHWIPAQWREFHELYEFARMRGWQREQLVFGVGAFAKPGVSFEQEYLKTLLLMRLDSGNFTPDQVEWVARQLEDWTPTLTLTPPPSRRRAVLRRSHGLAGTAPARPRAVGRPRACFSTPRRCTRASSSACAGCPSRTSEMPPARRPARARAAAAADAARVAVRPRRDRAGAARAALARRHRSARRRRPAGAHARGRRDRPACRTRRARPASRRATTRSRRSSIRTPTRNRSRGASAARTGG